MDAQQQKLFDLISYINEVQPPDPNYLAYLQNRSNAAKQTDLKGMAVDKAQGALLDRGGDYLANQFGNKFVTSEAQNALYNEAANQASGLAAGQATGGILSNAAGMGAGPLAAIAGATYLGGNAAYDMLKGKKPGLPGRVVLGMATGGLSEVARPFLNHKSTREVAQGHTKDLLSQNPNDANYQNYVQGMRQQYNAPPPDPTKPFAGKYATWEDYKKGGLEAGDLTGVYGNLKTFGNDWSNLDQAKRQAVTQGIINAGLYDSKKGEVNITDANKAKSIYQNIVGGQAPTMADANRLATTATSPQVAAQPQRTPGYDWNGKTFVKRK